MALTPFIYSDQIALGAGGSGTLQINIGGGEKARMQRFYVTSTAGFNITAIRTSTSTPYGDMSPSSPLPSSMLNVAGGLNGVGETLDPPLEIDGPLTLNIDVVDTSGAANTVTIAFQASREIGGA